MAIEADLSRAEARVEEEAVLVAEGADAGGVGQSQAGYGPAGIARAGSDDVEGPVR